MGRLERKNTIKKNVQEIQGFVPPEVKFRQKQSQELQDFILKKQLRDEGEENFFSNCCVDRPFTICCCAFIFLIAITAVAFSLDFYALNYPHERDFAIWDDKRVLEWDMIEATKLQLLKSDQGQDTPIRSEKMSKLSQIIVYKGKDFEESLITRKNLEMIQ